jgi:hypothetical protein
MNPEKTNVRDSVFVSYSRRDRRWLNELQTSLGALGDEVRSNVWDDSRISPAAEWRPEIDEALSTAAAAVLLLSEEFFASEFISKNELPLLMEAARRGELKLFPVVVSACSHGEVTAVYQAVNDPAHPLDGLDDAARVAVWKRLMEQLTAVGASIGEETRIAAEMVRLENDLADRPEIKAINEKMDRAKADPDLHGNYLENVICFVEGQRCQLRLTALMEEMQRPGLPSLRSKAIVRTMESVQKIDAAAQKRATELTQIFANEAMEMLKEAKEQGKQTQSANNKNFQNPQSAIVDREVEMAEVIFVSYARTDGEFALKLASDLRSANVNVWIDQLDIMVGVTWDLAVQDALQNCTGLLVILSPRAVSSRSVMDELSFALDENKKVFPVLYQASEIPFRLRRLQHIDFTSNYSTGLSRLVSALSGTSPAPRGNGDAGSNRTRRTEPGPRGRRSRLLTALLVGSVAAIVAAAAGIGIFANDPRMGTSQGSSLLFFALFGGLIAGLLWTVAGAVAGPRGLPLLLALGTSLVVLIAWIAIFGTYPDVLWAAMIFGCPVGGIIGAAIGSLIRKILGHPW